MRRSLFSLCALANSQWNTYRGKRIVDDAGGSQSSPRTQDNSPNLSRGVDQHAGPPAVTVDRIRFILFLDGLLLWPLATMMLLPAMIDLIDLNAADALHFLVISADRLSHDRKCMGGRGRLRALPLLGGSREVGFTDGMFESVSALTTTGSTILAGLDDMPRSILLLRSLLQWLGGIGIIAMAMSFLPTLRVGGCSSSSRNPPVFPENPLPRSARSSGASSSSISA